MRMRMACEQQKQKLSDDSLPQATDIAGRKAACSSRLADDSAAEVPVGVVVTVAVQHIDVAGPGVAAAGAELCRQSPLAVEDAGGQVTAWRARVAAGKRDGADAAAAQLCVVLLAGESEDARGQQPGW
jgi:hypothetical protein